MEDTRALEILMQKLETRNLPEAVHNELLLSISRICGTDGKFYRLLRHYQVEGDRSYATVAEEIKPEGDDKADVTLKYLRRRMEGMARRQTGDTAALLCAYLGRVDPGKLPPKDVMCFLLILSKENNAAPNLHNPVE